MIKVNFGSGPFPHEGWINVDLDTACRPDVVADLGRGLPFATSSVDFVLCDHAISCIGLEATRQFLAECRRLLKPGGTMRLLTPDLKELARLYLEQPQRLVDLWNATVGVPLATDSACEVFNLALEIQCRFQFDAPTFVALAREAGFDAEPVEYRRSRHPELAGLDVRPPDQSVTMSFELRPAAGAAG
ncbi:MAG: methyltransferase domain-containing protein [Betaproteobacteria bacterium]|jgi:SAM-dependent methyltransferase|nr:methyltransferase domain-containing protein [Betaproteobacteria bacterium]